MTQPDYEIKDLAGNVIGMLLGRSLAVSGAYIGKWDIVYIILQAQKYCGDAGVELLKFTNCTLYSDQCYPANDAQIKALDDMRRQLKVCKFSADSKAIFYAFYLMLLAPEGFNLTRPSAKENAEMLEEIDLSGSERLTANVLRGISTTFPNLRQLKLESCGLTHDDVADLSQVLKEGKITRLYLKGNAIEQDHLKHFAGLLYDNSERLLLENNILSNKADNDFKLAPYAVQVEYAPGMLATVPRWGGKLDLSRIDLNGARSDAEQNPHLVKLHAKLAASNPDEIISARPVTNPFEGMLTAMLLFSNTVTLIDMPDFIKSDTGLPKKLDKLSNILWVNFPNTKELIATGNNFEGDNMALTYKGADYSYLIDKAQKLERLSLNRCKMSDKDIFTPDGTSYLTATPAGQNLRYLNLAGNKLTDACIPHLLGWLGNSMVTEVDLSGNKISPEQQDSVSRALEKNKLKVQSIEDRLAFAQANSIDANALRLRFLGRKGRIRIMGIKEQPGKE